MGYDHLLFVLALVLFIQNRKSLFYTITAFTIAHSLTLILASLDLIFVSSIVVESLIALSIVFVAAEIVYDSRGKFYLAKKYPWLIASFFGLIHGLGFASVLKEIGLAPNDIVPSLLFFNLGVEIGQLLFITILLVLFFLIERFLRLSLNRYRIFLAYIIGSVAFFWFLERILEV
ncbi:membrane protein, putative [hydrothermal vent metagenome]|uniref:Membrane protein, putative n=1 Tax=hydrothermal vent metagenome TaxID=652676 RepID=A0A1W1BL90_9ZZZZ